MKGIRHVTIALSFVLLIAGAHAQNTPQYRSSCRYHKPGTSGRGMWTSDTSVAIMEAMIGSLAFGGSCHVDQKWSILGIRMPSKKIYLSPREK